MVGEDEMKMTMAAVDCVEHGYEEAKIKPEDFCFSQAFSLYS